MTDGIQPRQYLYKEPTVRKLIPLPPFTWDEIAVIAKEKDQSVAYVSAYLLQEGLDAYNKENKS